MKTVIQYGEVGGVVWENMDDDFPNIVPFTDIPPHDGIPLENQKFDPMKKDWLILLNESLSEEAREVVAFAVQSANLTDEQSLIVAEFYEVWQSGVEYIEGKIVRGKGDDPLLYRCRQKHISDEVNQPGIHTSAIWEVINVNQSGTIDDPIPAVANMQYYKDKYYLEDDVLYLCTRDSEIPLSHLPSQLIGHYFEIVENKND